MTTFKIPLSQLGNVGEWTQAELERLSRDLANNGLFNQHLIEAQAKYNSSPTEKVIRGQSNSLIGIGRDRPRGLDSGYGGQGSTHAGCIDLIAGLSGPYARQTKSDGTPLVTEKSPEIDAARIYISQRSNIDDYFHLPKGAVGEADARSSIAIKADAVRIISRTGIKLVTGTDTHDMGPGTPNVFVGGIDLIAGGAEAEDLEPIAKGTSLLLALQEFAELTASQNGLLMTLLFSLQTFSAALGIHIHGTPPSGGPTTPPDAAAADKIFQKDLAVLLGDIETHNDNIVSWVSNTCFPWGENYFCSEHNNTN